MKSRLTVLALTVAAAVLARLPAQALWWVGEATGEILYAAQPTRRGLVSANLSRICAALRDDPRLSAPARAAANGGRALDRLVRHAFRHYVHYYLEVLLLPGLSAAKVRKRLAIETPAVVDEAFRPEARARGVLVVALHFGAVELPAFYLGALGVPVTAPMETLSDPLLQRFLVERRSRTGVRVIGLAGAGTRLREALQRGEIVGLVADRDLSGRGMPVTLFGHTTTLPAGPALLAVESGAPVYVAAVRRLPGGRYAAKLVALETPASKATRRERVQSLLEAQARVFEELVAEAPEQWWSIFFPIWPDLDPSTAGRGRSPGTGALRVAQNASDRAA